MSDLEASWGGDLSISPTGDLATVGDPLLGTRRVLRRLMTNPADYLWNPDYGAGLAQFVGQPLSVAAVEALVRAQMSLEPAVSQTPEAVISVASETASLELQIRYEDSVTAMPSLVQTNIAG